MVHDAVVKLDKIPSIEEREGGREGGREREREREIRGRRTISSTRCNLLPPANLFGDSV
jgi:hypothetical protein